jgi:hypothetical protein
LRLCVCVSVGKLLPQAVIMRALSASKLPDGVRVDR